MRRLRGDIGRIGRNGGCRGIGRCLFGHHIGPVAHAAHGGNAQAAGSQLFTQAAHIHLNGVEPHVFVKVEQAAGDVVLADHATQAPHQDFEQAVFAVRQFQLGPLQAHPARGAVDDQAAHLPAPCHLALRAAQQGAATGVQLSEIEGLVQVVVRALVQRIHPVFDVRARRKHQHRGLVALPAQLGQQAQPVHARQPDVQQHQIKRRIAQHLVGFAPIALPVHRMALAPQTAHHGLGQIGVVFYQQDAHFKPSPARRCGCHQQKTSDRQSTNHRAKAPYCSTHRCGARVYPISKYTKPLHHDRRTTEWKSKVHTLWRAPFMPRACKPGHSTKKGRRTSHSPLLVLNGTP